MILGVAAGVATCGYAVLDEREHRFVDLGVAVTKKPDGALTLDRARRYNTQARILAEKIAGCSTVVVERLPDDTNVMPIALSWGVVLGLVASMPVHPRLLTIAPQKWQRAVLPNIGKADDYDVLARTAAKHLLARHPNVVAAFNRIDPKDRSRAISACMLALVGGLRAELCEEIGA